MERKIDCIIIHVADTMEDNPLTAKNEEMDIGTAEIESWHRERAKTEPWSHYTDAVGMVKYIGYHYVVRRSGFIEAARPVAEVGCHTKGMNKSSIGVCWVGRAHMTDKQKKSLPKFVAELCVHHGLSHSDVYPHCHFTTNKTCPNFNSALTFESIEAFRRVVEMSMRELK